MLKNGWNLKTACEKTGKKPHILWFHSYEMSRIGNSIDRKQVRDWQGLGREENEEWLLTCVDFSCEGDENVLQWRYLHNSQYTNILNCILLFYVIWINLNKSVF